jgi:hypothetical protein
MLGPKLNDKQDKDREKKTYGKCSPACGDMSVGHQTGPTAPVVKTLKKKKISKWDQDSKSQQSEFFLASTQRSTLSAED